MFQLHDLRESKVWQEAHETGIEEGESRILKRLVQKYVAKGMSVKAIADMMDLPVKDVRRFAKAK